MCMEGEEGELRLDKGTCLYILLIKCIQLYLLLVTVIVIYLLLFKGKGSVCFVHDG